MAKLTSVPTKVTISCGSTVKVRIKISDDAKDVNIAALGYDPSVCKLDWDSASTQDKGYVDLSISSPKDKDGKCSGGETTITFDAKNYDASTVDVSCSKG